MATEAPRGRIGKLGLGSEDDREMPNWSSLRLRSLEVIPCL